MLVKEIARVAHRSICESLWAVHACQGTYCGCIRIILGAGRKFLVLYLLIMRVRHQEWMHASAFFLFFFIMFSPKYKEFLDGENIEKERKKHISFLPSLSLIDRSYAVHWSVNKERKEFREAEKEMWSHRLFLIYWPIWRQRLNRYRSHAPPDCRPVIRRETEVPSYFLLPVVQAQPTAAIKWCMNMQAWTGKRKYSRYAPTPQCGTQKGGENEVNGVCHQLWRLWA